MAEILLNNETELLKALRSGQGSALRRIMEMYYPALLRFVIKIVEDRALAEDITEEAFIELWKNQRVFESLHSIRKFLWVAARHDCLDALRSRNTRKRYEERLSNQSDASAESSILYEIIRAEVLSDIYAAIRQLPEKMQRVFTMSYVDGMKNQEIADLLELSEQTVRNQKSRALDMLRVRFKDIDPEIAVTILCALIIIK